MYITRKSSLAKSPIDLNMTNSRTFSKFRQVEETFQRTIEQSQITSHLIWVGNGYTTENNQKYIIKLTVYWSRNNQNYIYFKERIQFDNIENH